MKSQKLVLGLIMLLLFTLSSCSLTDAGPLDDPCVDAQVYAFSTEDPYSGMSPTYVEEDDELVASWDNIASLGTPVFPIMPSNVSTYNYDMERFHFFSLATSQFINVASDDSTDVVMQTGGINGWKFSGLVYVSNFNSYFMVGVSYIDGKVGLVEVLDIDTGELAAVTSITVPLIDFSVGLAEIDNYFLNLSVATDNLNKVFVVSGRDLLTFDLSSTSGTHEVIGASTDVFYGLEYNNLIDKLIALKLVASSMLHLVEITPSAAPFVSDSSINISMPINDFASHLQYYSTTLSCDEKTYILTHRYANSSSVFYKIGFGGIVSSVVPSLITTETAPSYYYGLESNANN